MQLERQIAHWLKALAALAGDPGSVPSTCQHLGEVHMVAHNHL